MTRRLTKLLLAASALTVLAAAPAAFAAPVVDAKLYSAKKVAKTPAKSIAKTVKVAERGNRSRANRSTNTRRTANRTTRNRNVNVNRNVNRNVTTNRTRRNVSVNRGTTRNVNRRNLSRRNNSLFTRTAFNNGRGFRTNYRSNLGINFNFGSPGFSRYRWAPSAYSFYRPSFGSFGYYQSSTVCRRIVVDGWHRGYRAPISVKQCSNPWVGSYIVQGSERLVNNYW